MWWRDREDPRRQLTASLEDQVRFLRSELDARIQETERLHALLADKERNIQALSPRSPADRRLDAYFSPLVFFVLSAMGGGVILANFFRVEGTTVRWVMTGLMLAGVLALLSGQRLYNRMQSIDEESRKDPATDRRYQRSALGFAGLYMLGVLLFIAVTVLYAMN